MQAYIALNMYRLNSGRLLDVNSVCRVQSTATVNALKPRFNT